MVHGIPHCGEATAAAADDRDGGPMITLSGGWDLGYAIHHYNRPEGGRTLLGEAIYRYQYRKQWYLVDALARWAQSFLQETPSLRQPDLLVPVPSTGFSVDYDPTHLLVDWLSQLTGIPRAVGILSRQGLISEYGDPDQSPVRGSLQVTAPDAVKGRKVLLVDGIICSGTTLNLATQALRQAGSQEVLVLVFTRIERQSSDAFGGRRGP